MIPGMQTAVKKFVAPTSPVKNIPRAIADTATSGVVSGTVQQGGTKQVRNISSMVGVKKPDKTFKTAYDIIEDIDKLASELSERDSTAMYNILLKFANTQGL